MVTSFYEVARCLFEGADAVQQGAEDDIDPIRVAVLAGRVLDASGAGLAGVRVSVLEHPEFGWTTTRADGAYDLAVNGGGPLTLRWEHEGYLPVQRHRETEWRRYAMFPDVVMLAPSARVTRVELGSSASVVSGEDSTDESGSRRPRLLIPANTTATALLPDAERVELPALSVRMTEYTVGERGPAAMPGDLPPASAYTYAAELSVDEAEALGASSVEFDPPLPFHLDNFLDFPVGMTVPVGYYERNDDAWHASDSGLVIGVLAVDDGLASLDLDGDELAENAAALQAYGISEDELRAIGQEFEPGETLWRALIPHFSSWDLNWPFGNDDAEPPDMAVDPFNNFECGSESAGSIIGCEDQTLGEIFPIGGTAHALHYQSQRAPGRLDTNQLDIRLTGATAPASVTRIELYVTVLGQVMHQSFAPAANLWTTVVWDGRDRYGNLVQGRHPAKVQVEYVYPATYGQTTIFGTIAAQSTKYPTRLEVGTVASWEGYVGRIDAAGFGLGGLTLSEQHVYDPESRTLYLGTGAQRSAELVGDVIESVIGNGARDFSGDGGSARDAAIAIPHGLAVASDGSVFVSDQGNHCIRKVLPNGTISTYAGTPESPGNDGDGGPATLAHLYDPMGLALAADGTLYVADARNGRVRAIDPAGVMRTVLGGGDTFPPSSGDPIPALETRVSEPHALSLGPDGSLYVADALQNTIVRLTSDGRAWLFAGGGTDGGDGVFAREALIDGPLGLSTGSAGELFFTDAHTHRVRKIDANGVVTTVAGNGQLGFSGDGGPALEAALNAPHTVDRASDGSLYITDEGNSRVRRVRPDGIIETVAGGGSNGIGDGGSPLDADFSLPRVVFLHLDGSLYVADYSANRVRRVTQSLPGVTRGEHAIASVSASEVYVFDERGRHLHTTDAVTGARLATFEYTEAGALRSVADREGNRTVVERDGDAPSAIVSPFGVRTGLTLNADGYVRNIANADGGSYTLEYHPLGLLARLTDPRSPDDLHEFGYDELGRLVSDTSPTGFRQRLTRGTTGATRHVTLRSSLGLETRFEITPSSDLPIFVKRTVDAADLTTTVIHTQPFEIVQTPSGTETTLIYSPDPRFGLQSAYVSRVETTSGSLVLHPLDHERSVEFDEAGELSRLTEITSIDGRTHSLVWDIAQRSITKTSPRGRVSRASWDDLGRIVNQSVGPFFALDTTFDARGLMTATNLGTRARSFAHDGSGFVMAVTNELDVSFGILRDPLGRITTLTHPDEHEVDYRYDLNGNLTQVTPPGKEAHVFAYGASDLLESYTAPSVAAGEPTSVEVGYDDDERIANIRHAGGQSTILTYDSAGRLSRSSDPEGAIEFTYDPVSGKLATIDAPAVDLEFGHDGDFQIATRYRGSVSGVIEREHDAYGHLRRERVEAGTSLSRSIAYTYDEDGLLIGAGTETLIRAAEHPFVLWTTADSFSDNYVYSDYAEVREYVAMFSGSPIYTLNVERDALGRLTQRSETLADASTTEAFTYDDLGRLTRVERTGGVVTTFGYDGNGNRTSFSSGNTTVAATYDAQDRLQTLGTTSYAFDANGALSEKHAASGSTRYRYDLRGNLREVTLPDGRAVSYTVDGLDRRVAKMIDGTTVSQLLYSDALRPIAELGATGNIVSHFVYGARANIPDLIVRGGRTYRIVSDLVGSVRLVVDTVNGEVVQRLDYDPLGKIVLDTNPGFQPFGFAGGLYDPDTALVRFGARDYDPETGRFTHKDPAQFGGGLNFYVYAGNDPINYADPAGESPVLAAALAGAAIGAAESAAVSFATQALGKGCVDWGEVGREALVGGVFGAAGGALGGLTRGLSPRTPCPAGSCSCFVRGTPVDSAAGPRPIEQVELGERIGPESEECASLDLSAWSEISARMPKGSFGGSDELDLQLLRPTAWVTTQRLEVGTTTALHLDELNITGDAYVTDIRRARRLAPGTRCPATALIRHVSDDVVTLELERGPPIHGTAGHRLYSATRLDWVRLDALHSGETLDTRDGQGIRITRVGTTRHEPTEVWNLEVFGEHRYYVGEQGVWAHNTYGSSPPGAPKIVQHPSQRAARRAAEREAGMGRHGGRSSPREVPLRPGSQSPRGAPGTRTEVTSTDTGMTVHHDPYGHVDGPVPPHYGVDTPGGTTHHTYPSKHDPTTNR